MNNEPTVLSFHQKKAHFEAGNRLLARIDQLELFKANLEGYSKDVEFRFDANTTQKSVRAMTMIDQQDAMGNLLLIGRLGNRNGSYLNRPMLGKAKPIYP